MFEAEQKPECGSSEYPTGTADLPEKRQYTIKGIEAEAIDLMRAAATKEGMKIGAWVSARMKEAASRSLGPALPIEVPAARQEPSCATGRQTDETPDSETLAAAVREVNTRLREIESELHQITKSQRTIMTKILDIA